LIVAAIFLEAAVFCVHSIEHVADAPLATDPRRRPVGGGAIAALPQLIRSPYLLGVAIWVSLLSFGATIAYFAQANIVSATIHDAATQTRLFAGIDLAVSVLSLATQVFATAKFLERFGTGISAATLPTVYIVGFAAVAIAPSLSVVVTLQVAQRWMNFAIANPARQVFFTVVGREEKYKAKNLIDVVIYRGSDALYGWVYDSLQALGLKLGAIALCALPVVAGWLVISIALGRTQEHLSTKRDDEGAPECQSR
jgi:AAA family ATP:ADP antiporter